MSDLLPCPFCGSVDIESGNVWCDDEEHNDCRANECNDCGTTGPIVLVVDKDNQHEPDDAWNRRS